MTSTAATNEGPTVPTSTSVVVRWAPLVLPLTLCVASIGYLAWTITWIPDGWNRGERILQLVMVRTGATYAILACAAFLGVKRADHDSRWRWAAWAAAGVALVNGLFPR